MCFEHLESRYSHLLSGERFRLACNVCCSHCHLRRSKCVVRSRESCSHFFWCLNTALPVYLSNMNSPFVLSSVVLLKHFFPSLQLPPFFFVFIFSFGLFCFIGWCCNLDPRRTLHRRRAPLIFLHRTPHAFLEFFPHQKTFESLGFIFLPVKLLANFFFNRLPFPTISTHKNNLFKTPFSTFFFLFVNVQIDSGLCFFSPLGIFLFFCGRA